MNMSKDQKALVERSLFIFVLFTTVAAYIYVVSPDLREAVRPYHCLFYQTTGLLCPACGGTRAMAHLFGGRFQLALQSNALAVLMLPILFYVAAVAARLAFDRRFTAAHIKVAPFWLWMVFSLVLLFWVLRNLPGFSFLSNLL